MFSPRASQALNFTHLGMLRSIHSGKISTTLPPKTCTVSLVSVSRHLNATSVTREALKLTIDNASATHWWLCRKLKSIRPFSSIFRSCLVHENTSGRRHLTFPTVFPVVTGKVEAGHLSRLDHTPWCPEIPPTFHWCLGVSGGCKLQACKFPLG